MPGPFARGDYARKRRKGGLATSYGLAAVCGFGSWSHLDSGYVDSRQPMWTAVNIAAMANALAVTGALAAEGLTAMLTLGNVVLPAGSAFGTRPPPVAVSTAAGVGQGDGGP